MIFLHTITQKLTRHKIKSFKLRARFSVPKVPSSDTTFAFILLFVGSSFQHVLNKKKKCYY